MLTAYIVIFMLFFAVLAFGWFYWQRAKARDAGTAADDPAASASADAPPAATDAPMTDAPASQEMASSSTDQQ